jgi:hypothetical protein
MLTYADVCKVELACRSLERPAAHAQWLVVEEAALEDLCSITAVPALVGSPPPNSSATPAAAVEAAVSDSSGRRVPLPLFKRMCGICRWIGNGQRRAMDVC